jgi:DNA (cytosine-5)-methyltransferase 1
MAAYYNENDQKIAAWLKELIKRGLVADGEVDTRSIVDVRPDDVAGFTQCHWFAGIGGWSLALRIAGWSDDRAVWTGSCPCQPFSLAGKGDGFADERHLWPAWHWLIQQRRPVVVFGEQVASPAGRAWLDLVSTDMEGIVYALGAAVLPVACVGAPGERHRLWFVADTNGERRQKQRLHLCEWQPRSALLEVARGREAVWLGDASGEGLALGPLEDDGPRALRIEGRAIGEAGLARGFWAGADWLYHSDGKYRPVEPGTFPLAARLPGDVDQIRGYGNAINPYVAAEFIAAYLEAEAATVTR